MEGNITIGPSVIYIPNKKLPRAKGKSGGNEVLDMVRDFLSRVKTGGELILALESATATKGTAASIRKEIAGSVEIQAIGQRGPTPEESAAHTVITAVYGQKKNVGSPPLFDNQIEFSVWQNHDPNMNVLDLIEQTRDKGKRVKVKISSIVERMDPKFYLFDRKEAFDESRRQGFMGELVTTGTKKTFLEKGKHGDNVVVQVGNIKKGNHMIDIANEKTKLRSAVFSRTKNDRRIDKRIQDGDVVVAMEGSISGGYPIGRAAIVETRGWVVYPERNVAVARFESRKIAEKFLKFTETKTYANYIYAVGGWLGSCQIYARRGDFEDLLLTN